MKDARYALNAVAEGCEISAKIAASCARECPPDGSHSPEWFEGWRAAMVATAEQCRLVANGASEPSLRVVR